MQLTITTSSDDLFTLEVSDDMELENFKVLCEVEANIPSRESKVFFNGEPLGDNKKQMKDYGISNGDILLVQRVPVSQPMEQEQPPSSVTAVTGLPPIDFGAIQMPGTSQGQASRGAEQTARVQSIGGLSDDDPARLMDNLLKSPYDLSLLKERNPPLAEALLSGSVEKFTEVLRNQEREKAEHERQRIQLLNGDPFDPNVQAKIQEEIRLKNVESNMEAAMEFAPESFGQVVMLYVDCMVNGHPVKAFVDSGAQMTIMSQRCAERCGIMRLVDQRWAGIAKGVGTQKIIGRVHLCPIQIGTDFLQTSFSILEHQPMDMLLGLDMLKRHQCILDLRQNKLVIGTTGNEIDFLSEGELPEHARLNRQPSAVTEEEDMELAEAISKSVAESNATAGVGAGTSTNSTGAATSSTASVPPTDASASASKTAGANVTVPSAGATDSNTATSTGEGLQLAEEHATVTARSTAASSITQNAGTTVWSEETVQRITSAGFSRAQAVAELEAASGDADQALMALIAKSLSFPPPQ